MSKADILRVTGMRRRNVALRKVGRALTPDESERVARFVRVLDTAVDYFGSKDEAWNWLQITGSRAWQYSTCRPDCHRNRHWKSPT